MIPKMLRGLLGLAVFVVCMLAGLERTVHAAVMVEQLPAAANPPEILPGASASALSGRDILLTGGEDTSKFKYPQHSYIFNTASQTWSSNAPPLNIAYHKLSKLQDGKVLVTGGAAFTSGVGYTYNNLARIYNASSNTWTNAVNLPHVSFGHSQSTLPDGRVLVAGGANEIYSVYSSTLYNNAYLYDPSANRWDEVAPLPIGLYGAAQSTLKDGRVMVTGGQSGYIYSYDTYIYDPSHDTWTKKARLPYEGGNTFFRHAQVTLTNGKVLVMGNNYFYLYDPDTDTWVKDNPNLDSLVNASMIPIGNDVYLMGGYNKDYVDNRSVYKLTFDFIPPTAPFISGAPSDWTAEDVNLTLTPGTDAESGVNRTEYSLSGATAQDWTPYTEGTPITITNSGQTQISARTVDNAGNLSSTTTAVVKIDRVPPTAPAINRSSSSWSSADVTFTLTGAADTAGSGVNRLEFSMTGATTLDWIAYTGTVTVTAEGQTTIKARAIDNAGNISTESTADINIDKTAPTKPIVTPATTAWSKNDVSVTITPGTDGGSGVGKTEYRLSGGSWTAYGGPFTISAEGQTVIEARSMDNAGNISAMGTATVQVDKTLPTAPAVNPASIAWSNGASVDVTITGGTDSGSGVNRTEYSLSGATVAGWTTYAGPITVTAEGQTDIAARTIDKAGNISAVSSKTVKIDRTPPAVPAISPPGGSWTSSNVNVTITPGTDSHSGVNRVEYSLSGATMLDWTPYTAPIAITSGGTTTVSARTVDNAGNVSTTSTAAQLIDKIAPQSPTLTPSVTGWTSAAAVTVSAADGADSGGSGVKRTEYSLTGATTLAWTAYTAPIVIDKEGQTTVTARTVDHAGNVSSPTSTVVQIDQTVPTSPTLSASASTWTPENVNVTVTAGTDNGGSGVQRTEYSLTGATALDWTPYTGAIVLSAEGQTTITARTVDNAGNRSVAAARTVSIDKTAPTAPVIAGTTDWTAVDSVSVTITAGTDDGGSGVQKVEYSLSGAVTLGWSPYTVELNITAEGQTTVSARTVDKAGNQSEVQTHSVSIDRTPPAAPVVTPGVSGWTSADAVPVAITAGTDVGGSGVSRTEYSLSGATALDWTIYSSELSIMAEGQTIISARSVDQAGNVGPASTAQVQIDRTAPAAPILTSPASGAVTSNNKPVIRGTAEAGAAVKVSIDGNDMPLAAADSSGHWSYTISVPLTDSLHTITAVAIDAAGNSSETSEELLFTVDTVAPDAPDILYPVQDAVMADAKPNITGTAEARSTVTIDVDAVPAGTTEANTEGKWTFVPAVALSDGLHTLSAKAADAAGNTSPASAALTWTVDTAAPLAPIVLSPVDGTLSAVNRPVISGTAEAGAEIQIRLDGSDAAVVKADGSGQWAYTPTAAIVDGTHSVQATAKDAAGNTSPASAAVSWTIDTEPPQAPVIEAPAEGAVLSTAQPVLRGSAEASASIRITLDGGANASIAADSSGSWEFTPASPLSEGQHFVKAQAIDAAGNMSPVSIEHAFIVDTIAPAAPVVLHPVDGSVTNRSKPEISGTSESSVTISVYVDGTRTADVKADTEGKWSYAPAAGLALGLHSVQAQAADAAGNVSTVSAENRFTVVSDNAGLGTLELSGVALNETVTSTTYSYTAKAPYDTKSTSIIAAPADANATVQILQNGQSVSNPVSLQVGSQTFTVQVTAQDGITVQPYTVTITREPSNDTGLAELSVSPAILSPQFDKGVTRYTSTVTNNVYSITVQARASSPAAALQINGVSVTGGSGSVPLELKVGSNPVKVTVTAQDGVTTQSYEVDVIRIPSSNGLLNGLQLSAGDLSPSFNSGVFHYETAAGNETASTTVTASVYDRNATLTINGQLAASGKPSQPIGLKVGSNPITVLVTAQDGVSTQSYTVDVHRQPSSKVSLTGLTFSAGVLTPSFDSGITAYDVYAGYGAVQTTVTASVYEPDSQITLNGKAIPNGQASEAIPLQIGNNVMDIQVTAQDRKTKLSYTVIVHRAPPSGSRGGSSGSSPAVILPPEEGTKPAEEPKQPEKPADGKAQRCYAPAPAVHFTDMPGHWAEQNVTEAAGCGIVSGFEDGTFRPDEAVTRAQFVVMLMQTMNPAQGRLGAEAIPFTDRNAIPAWAAPAVGAAVQSGIVNGYEDGTFRPDAQVTRAEMMTMAAKAFRLAPASPESVNGIFSDAESIPAWAKGYAAAAQQKGLVQGRERGNFAPNDRTTRAEAVTLLLSMQK
ncbi:OmpL47-type beta-barrel domain-containing protein [Paenibacillus sp. OAS669]|uniref:OmpL47-type beta-barrel domain-containing protein n=1 Tax=Paenibacillus sp. OAS669 TaxID=2663821 RepID=UPI0017894663|nr:Ig-like domain-containing protein [Paenibacillus sp. OAS669]MBE1444898.1 N-acetylneuraminic acid mutarotase [Paenibacillus sp. OAS669]